MMGALQMFYQEVLPAFTSMPFILSLRLWMSVTLRQIEVKLQHHLLVVLFTSVRTPTLVHGLLQTAVMMYC